MLATATVMPSAVRPVRTRRRVSPRQARLHKSVHFMAPKLRPKRRGRAAGMLQMEVACGGVASGWTDRAALPTPSHTRPLP
ncbi:hypothetical protein GCM10010841_06160 [Deinococcus aerophilus]|uniref:Uncharacterized protein n=1 Tax=Deinococcus aerophilus TaxID=522488 RepID=A0ABQ2GK27_9DEIO|nr:hypothetical protein GCM10010841_06160 [Deinococcus aerophilus]